MNTLQEITRTPSSSATESPLAGKIISLAPLWPWFLLSVTVCLASAFIYLRYTTPIYEISASVLVKDDTKGTDLGEAAILENLGLSAGKSNVDNEVEVLRSRNLMEQVVKDLQLHITYFAKGKIKTTEIFETSPIKFEVLESTESKTRTETPIYHLEFDKENRFTLSDHTHIWKQTFGDTFSLPVGRVVVKKGAMRAQNDDSYLISVGDINSTTKKYSQALRVSVSNKQVSIIRLILKDILPLKGEAILSKLIENYLQASIHDKNRIADSTISFIDQNLALVTKELKGVEERIEKFRENNQITDFTEQARLLLEHGQSNSQRNNEIELQLSILESLMDYMKRNPSTIVPSSIVMQQPDFVARIAKYNELQILRDRTLSSTTPEHPNVQNLDEQLRNLRLEFLNQLQVRRKELELNRREILKEDSDIHTKIHSLPGRERIFLGHARQQQIKQELYIFLLKKRVETSISKSSTLANGRIIDKPRGDEYPVSPNSRITILVALLLGLFFPIAYDHIVDLFSIRITSKKQLVDAVSAPIIGEVGKQKSLYKQRQETPSNGSVQEQFRILRTNLNFISSINKDKVILITSSMAGEGKTFIAINLCKTLQMAGKKVILVECDLRRPRLSETFTVPQKIGLTHYIISSISVQEVTQKLPSPELFDVITAGIVPPNPAELLLSERVGQLLHELKSHYDYIILDTAPFGIVTDAHILSQYADISLYVVRQDFTFRHQLERIQEISTHKILPKLHLILNGAKLQSGYGYDVTYQS